MKQTKIEWTDFSWNPWQGCKKVSPACDNCYMFRDKKRYGQKGSDIYRSSKTTFNKPLKMEAGSKVFTCSWSDFFLAEADEWRDDAWDIIRKTPHLIYQILTKRPENIKDRLPEDWDENFSHVWLGVTAENQEMANKRIPVLLDIPAAVHFVSIEPMLGRVFLRMAEFDDDNPMRYADWLDGEVFSDGGSNQINKIDWVIVGGESGRRERVRPMEGAWVNHIAKSCYDTKTAFFFKQWGAHVPNDAGMWGFENVKQFPKIAQ